MKAPDKDADNQQLTQKTRPGLVNYVWGKEPSPQQSRDTKLITQYLYTAGADWGEKKRHETEDKKQKKKRREGRGEVGENNQVYPYRHEVKACLTIHCWLSTLYFK